MGSGSKTVAVCALFYVGLVMAKDGTLTKFVGNVSTGVQTLVSGGLKPLTPAA